MSSFVYAQPKAAFIANVTSGCPPLVVQFQDNSTGSPSSYKWSLGNGTISTEKNPGAVYINPGTYTVTLEVSSGALTDKHTETGYIVVYALPTVDFSVLSQTGCVPFNTQFKDLSKAGSGEIVERLWDFGDGQISSDINPSHTFISSDSFDITLTVRNSLGCRSIAGKENFIAAGGGMKADFSYDYTNACKPPTPVTFKNQTVSARALNYQWNFGNGATSNAANPGYTYTAAGDFMVQLIASDNTGCADTISKPLSIGSVNANFDLPLSRCANTASVFVNTSSPEPVSVIWYFGDGTTTHNINASRTYASPGVYDVKMVADFGSCKDSVTKTITISTKPVIDFTTTGNLATCAVPNSIQFNNKTTGAVTYQWSFGDGSSSKEVTPNHTYTTKGTFDVKLAAFNAEGCGDSITRNGLVKMGPPVIVKFENAPFKVCAPDTVKFKPVISSPEPLTNYQWDFGDGTKSTEANPAHIYKQPGSYAVSLIVKTAGGCSDTLKYANAVIVGERPNAKFSVDPTISCAHTLIKFKDESTGSNTEWNWAFGDNTTSSQQSPGHFYRDTGSFTVSLIVFSGGCSDTSTIKDVIYIKPPVAKFKPTGTCAAPLERKFSNNSLNALSWSWDFGDGNSSADKNPQHTYAAPGTYNAMLTVKNGQCEDNETIKIVVVDENPVFDYTTKSGKDYLCKNETVNFIASNFNISNISSFEWIYNDGTTSGIDKKNSKATHRFFKAGTFETYLIVKDILGCTDTIKKAVLLNVYGPTASFTNDAGACINGTIGFNDISKTDGLHSITQWVWYYGDGKTETLNSGAAVKHQYTIADSFDVALKVQDNFGCQDSLVKKKAVIIENPLANFKTKDSVKCTSGYVQFNDLSTGTGLKYAWDFGDNSQSTTRSPAHKYTNEGVYPVSLKIIDKFGCSSAVTKAGFVTVSNPRAAFSVTDAYASCPPLLVQPVNKSSGYTSVAWSFGNGVTSSVESASHNYTQGGNYNLKLTVKGYGECYDDTTIQIVLKGPSGSLNYPATFTCSPATVTFNATVKNASGLLWDFGDGVTKPGNIDSIKYTYADAGRYLPALVLTDNNNCQVAIPGKDTIRVSGIKAAFTDSLLSQCDSAVLRFEDSTIATNDVVKTYDWVFGDGTSLSNTKNPDHAYHKSGKYTVRLVVNSAAGCSDTYNLPLNVKVNPNPLISIQSADTACISGPVDFAATNEDANAAEWSWAFDAGNTASVQNPQYSFANSGEYTVNVTAKNAFGCTDTESKKITILNPPVVDAGAGLTICLDQTASLQATGATAYQWASNPTLSCDNCGSPIAAPPSKTTYYVTGTTVKGCSAKDSVIIDVKQPSKVIAGQQDTVCVGERVQLNASGTETYKWSPASSLDNAGIANPKASPTATTVYTVTGSDSQGCFSDIATVTVVVYPKPFFNIDDSALTVSIGTSKVLTTTSSPDVTTWQWSPAKWLSSATSPNPLMDARADVTYEATASNPGGCTATDRITVKVLCNSANLYVPNTFSPNGDGSNDWFFPRGSASYFNIKSMRVFNRWGQLMFEKTNFKANTETEGWNGTYKNNPQPADVYVYVMEIICDNNNVNMLKGNITLLR